MKRAARPIWCLVLLAAGVEAYGGEAAKALVEVRFPREAVVGLPLPVQFIVHGEASVAPGRLMGKTNPFAFEMRSDGATYGFPARHHLEVRPPRRNYHRPGPEVIRLPMRKTRLERGESCEFVIDLSLLDRVAGPLDPRHSGGRPGRGKVDGIAPGRYVLEFLTPGFEFECRPGSIRLAAPNAEERKLLRNLSLTGSSRPKWLTFVERNDRATAGVDVKGFSGAGRRQLAFHSLLAGLVKAKRPVGELALRPGDLEDFLPGYRNEALLLRYELELARADRAGAEKTRAEILAQRPQAGALLDYVRKRGGRIARSRRAMGKAPGPGTERP